MRTVSGGGRPAARPVSLRSYYSQQLIPACSDDRLLRRRGAAERSSRRFARLHSRGTPDRQDLDRTMTWTPPSIAAQPSGEARQGHPGETFHGAVRGFSLLTQLAQRAT